MHTCTSSSVQFAGALPIDTVAGHPMKGMMWGDLRKNLMIQLTRLNKHPIGVNSDLIKFVENAPDTMITLLTGEKILVRESFEEIIERIVAFRQRVLAGLDVMDYVANAKGPEIARLPGVNKATTGIVELKKEATGSPGATEGGKPEESR